MPNDLASFMNSVASEFNDLTKNLRPHAAYLSAVHINPTPSTPLPPNETVKVNLVTIDGDAVNALTDAPSLKDVDTTATSLKLDKLASIPFKFSDYDIMRAPDSPGLIAKTVEAAGLKIVEFINDAVADLFTTTTFNTAGNTTRTATPTAGPEITATELAKLRTVLSTRKIPIADRGNLFIITHPEIYGRWLTADDMAKASTLGDEWSSNLRGNGELRPQFNFLPLEDYQAPVSGTTPEFTYQTAMFHRDAAVLVNAMLPPPPAGTAVSYASMFGLPIRITAQFNQNLGATGGAYTSFLVECLFGIHAHRKPFCAIHTTVLDA